MTPSSSLLWTIALGLFTNALVLAKNSTTGSKYPLTDIVKPYNVEGITVSGISSGGYMAVQMHIAYSELVSGAAIFAGGPFYCAEGTVLFAETKCMTGSIGGPDVTRLVDLTRSDAKFNYIDDPSNLKNDRVFVFSGMSDTVVSNSVVHALQAYYSYFMDATRIETSYDINAEHCLPTLDYGEDCLVLGSPYLGKCGYDGAGNGLRSILGTSLAGRTTNTPNLFEFLQAPYITGPGYSIGDVGYIYVPTTCQNGAKCQLHVSFHGCHQGTEEIGDDYAAHAGFNEWAENNNIIVVYPMVKPSQILPLNPNGCWDWWGYTNKVTYGVREGPQMEFVRRIIKAIAGI